MKQVLTLIILVFSFQSWIYANEINDFEIGGISLGQSLLKYVNKNQIGSIKDEEQYSNDKYIRYDISKILTIKGFDLVNVMTKKGDTKYIIEGISAGVYYDKLEECLDLKDEMEKNVESILEANQKQDTEFPTKQDSTGESIVYGVQYYTKPYPSNESIMINCYHMSERSNIRRALRISVNTNDYAYFVVNEAYN
tara:strand:+ start:601 stop:1185 length:585 start_codon:yes stop_codon:yes gene_type:complete